MVKSWGQAWEMPWLESHPRNNERCAESKSLRTRLWFLEASLREQSKTHRRKMNWTRSAAHQGRSQSHEPRPT